MRLRAWNPSKKSRRISCRTGIPLKGSRRRLTAIPCVTGSFTKASAISGVLLSLTLPLQEKNEEVLYARDLIEASLIYAFQKKLTFDHWYSLIVQIREFESSGSYDGFLINGFNGSYSAFPLARMENYVQMNSCFYAETMYTLQRTLTVEKDLGRLGENQEFVSYMCENIRMFCDGREKSRYYICKYFLFYLNTRIKYYMASDKNRRIKRNIYLDLPLSNISKMDPNRHAHMSEEEIKECLATAKISPNKLFELLNRFIPIFSSVIRMPMIRTGKSTALCTGFFRETAFPGHFFYS